MHWLVTIHKSFCRFLVKIMCVLIALTATAQAAVVLQYHHVSVKTPKITSIAPEQFDKHLALLREKQYQVIALPELMAKVQAGENIDRHVAITFDDGYKNLLEHAIPALEAYQYPYTIFINPKVIDDNTNNYLTWPQLAALTQKGATIANHGMTHDSLARIPTGTSMEEWLSSQAQNIIGAEQRIKEMVGQSVRLFAYPYGEFTPQLQQWLTANNFIAFTQQSGAVGNFTDLSQVPRFPVSYPYDQITSLSDKLNTLAFDILPEGDSGVTVVNYGYIKELVMRVNTVDFHPKLLACYVSGLGRQEVTWIDEKTFKMTLSEHLKPGRQRSNCTAPSISKPNRYYWYSKPWFVLNENGTWFPL